MIEVSSPHVLRSILEEQLQVDGELLEALADGRRLGDVERVHHAEATARIAVAESLLAQL